MHSFRDSPGLLFVALALTACSDAQEPQAAASQEAPPEASREAAASTCGEAGRLTLTLAGALHTERDLRDAELQCESMPRPDDRGVRMRFSADIGGERLVVIIAMPDLVAGTTGTEVDTIVTMTVEGSGRFFSTPNLGACWTDITRNEPLSLDAGGYIVAGEVSCVGPLGEFNGDAFVEVRELVFSGIADWGTS